MTEMFKRIGAGTMSAILSIGLLTSGLSGTLAQSTDATPYGYDYISTPVAYRSVIAQAANNAGQAIDASYMYFDTEDYFLASQGPGDKVFSVLQFGEDFFGDIGEHMNVFFHLDGANHHYTGNYICGGEDRNPAVDGQPAILAKISGESWFLAGPYTAGTTSFYYVDAKYDAAAAAKQGAVGDGLLQGPETGKLTDLTVIYDSANGTLTPTESHLSPDGGEDTLFGPVDINGDGTEDYLKPAGPNHVYEVVDENGTSKTPPEYVYDKNTDGDGDPTTAPDALTPVEKVTPGDATTPGGYYVEEPENIWHPVKPDGTSDPNLGVWGGEDGQIGTTSDNEVVNNIGGKWYTDNGDNTFHPIDGQNKGEAVGGGGDKDPSTDPVIPIYTHPDTGEHYVGPLDTNGDGIEDAYYGAGDDGSLDSTADALGGDDERYFIDPDTGKPTPTDPATVITGVSLDVTSANLTFGKTLQLTATITPSTAAGKTVSWTSSDSAVAKVSASGLVSAVSEGSATITATVDDKSDTCAVTVKAGTSMGGGTIDMGQLDLPEVTGDTPVSVWDYDYKLVADGYCWRILAVDKDGNCLITTCDAGVNSRLIQNGSDGRPMRTDKQYYAITNVTTFGKNNAYDGSALSQAMDTFYVGLSDLLDYEVPYILPSGMDGYSYVSASSRVYGCFALSATEASNLFQSPTARVATLNGTAKEYWLRSSDIINANPNFVSSSGTVGFHDFLGSSYGVRPALWVNFG